MIAVSLSRITRLGTLNHTARARLAARRSVSELLSFSRNMATLETLKFDNGALKSLPIDGDEQNYVRTVAGKPLHLWT